MSLVISCTKACPDSGEGVMLMVDDNQVCLNVEYHGVPVNRTCDSRERMGENE